jgi:hypothetical protein
MLRRRCFQEPGYDFEPPAKMPKVSQYNRPPGVVRPNVVTQNYQPINGATNNWPG